MQNTHLIARWYHGITIPELWYLRAKEGDIFITLTDLCWKILQTLPALQENMLPNIEESWGVGKVFTPVKKSKDGYTLQIPLASQVNTEAQKDICRSLSTLTEVLVFLIQAEAEEKRQPRAGEQVQLFSMNTYYNEAMPRHGAGMEVSMSPEAATFLVARSMTIIPGVHKAMKVQHAAQFPKHKKIKAGGLFNGLTGVIREKGTLDYKTFGDCACLGKMPEDIQENEGLHIESHNLDHSWQQLNMIIGVATTWEWVRNSLGYK